MSTIKSPSKKQDTRKSRVAMKLAFPDLREKYGTVEELQGKLKELDRPTLEALILNGAFPEKPIQAKQHLRHCVYCHKTFNAEDNQAACAVEHFLEMEPLRPGEYLGLEDVFLCCGKLMDNCDVWGDETRAEELEPFCYEGQHWEKEITTDDENEVGEEVLGMVDDDGKKLPRAWWREWRKHGNTCEKKGCSV